MGRYGATLLRLEALERLAGLAEMPEVPGFDLPDLDGNRVVLGDVLDGGKPVLLVFTSPTCTHCQELVPELAEWQSRADSPLEVLIVSEGSVEANRAKWADSGIRQVLLRDGDNPMGACGVEGTPAAVLVAPDGARAAEPMHAVDGVRSLHASALQPFGAGPASHRHVQSIEPRPRDIGEELPEELELVSEDGSRVSVRDATEQETVLLFWRFDCGFCARIVEDVRTLERTARALIVTTSTVEQIRETGLTSPVMSDPDSIVGNWLRVPGTPSAVRVQRGRLTAGLAVGGPEVLTVLDTPSPLSDAALLAGA